MNKWNIFQDYKMKHFDADVIILNKFQRLIFTRLRTEHSVNYCNHLLLKHADITNNKNRNMAWSTNIYNVMMIAVYKIIVVIAYIVTNN